MFKKILPVGVLASVALIGGYAQSAPMTFFGENQTPVEMTVGAPVLARSAFLGSLTGGVGTETFESRTPGNIAPLAISFPGSSGNITATITGSGSVFETPSTHGRFNTTGASAAPTDGKWWQVSDAFTIDFSSAVSAFGFYGTDIGDFNGRITIALTDTNDVVTVQTIQNSINGADGSLLFWGFIDTVNSYKKITFGNTSLGAAEPDFFGFDDMVIGDREQIRPPGNDVPEPGTLALFGLALIGATVVRRRLA